MCIRDRPEPWRWRFVHLPEAESEAQMARLESHGFARLRPHLAVGLARGPVPTGVLAFDADPSGALELLPGFAAQVWDLAPHARAYRDLIARFAPLEGMQGTGAESLAARLLLVHAWRQALLHDPRLPAAALPTEWAGHAARTLFHRLYAALSPAADSHIGARFEAASGMLATTTAATQARSTAMNDQQPQGLPEGAWCR